MAHTPSLANAPIDNSAASGDITVVTGVANKTIAVHRLRLSVAGATVITFKNGSTPFGDKVNFVGAGAEILDLSERPWYATAAGNALVMNSSNAVQVNGLAEYVQN